MKNIFGTDTDFFLVSVT